MGSGHDDLRRKEDAMRVIYSKGKGMRAHRALRLALPLAAVVALAAALFPIDHQQGSPNPVARSTTSIVARFHVTACGGRSVQGALVYATTVPFSQFSILPEQPTGADGWVTLRMRRLSGFPVSRHQRLLVMFGRARKAGERVIAGISTRRLVASRVNLSR